LRRSPRTRSTSLCTPRCNVAQRCSVPNARRSRAATVAQVRGVQRLAPADRVTQPRRRRSRERRKHVADLSQRTHSRALPVGCGANLARCRGPLGIGGRCAGAMATVAHDAVVNAFYPLPTALLAAHTLAVGGLMHASGFPLPLTGDAAGCDQTAATAARLHLHRCQESLRCHALF
jgi:hypothetical protein